MMQGHHQGEQQQQQQHGGHASASTSTSTSRSSSTRVFASSSSSSSPSSLEGGGDAPRRPSFVWRNRLDFGPQPPPPGSAGEEDEVTGAGRLHPREGGEAEVRNAVVVLNTDCVGPLMERLWGHASLRVCADGGANRIFDASSSSEGAGGDSPPPRFVPDFIKGDLDSLRPEVGEFYQGLGAEVIRDPDQDTNDLEKCLELVRLHGNNNADSDSDGGVTVTGTGPPCPPRQPTGSSRRTNVFVVGALGLRLDHLMANLHMLYRYDGVFRRLVLVGNESLAFLLPPGRHVIHPDTEIEGPVCGLLPVAQACRAVTTTGLRWDLQGEGMAFGGLVSTSNEMLVHGKVDGADVREGEGGREGHCEVTVETSDPLVWTTTIRRRWRKATMRIEEA